MSLREAFELIIFLNALQQYARTLSKAFQDAEVRKKIAELTEELMNCTDLKCYEEIKKEIARLEKLLNERYGNVKPKPEGKQE